MTTKSIRPVTRETSAFAREGKMKPIVVTLVGSTLMLRAKGLRRTEALDVASCYHLAVKQRVVAERAARKAARKGGKK